MFTIKTFAFILAAATAATALPTATTPDGSGSNGPTGTEAAPGSGTTHIVATGKGGVLDFQPGNIAALPGDVVEFHFAPRNHSVVQSSFEAPCVQLADGGFNSGFEFAVPDDDDDDDGQVQSERVYRITVVDAKPIWFFCGQGNHCNQGMVGVINANTDTPNTFDRYRDAAVQPGVVTQLLEPTGGNLGAAAADNTRFNDGL